VEKKLNIVTLLTDFGLKNVYVAQMKGVIYSIAPQAKCVDITNCVPHQKVRVGSFILESSVDFFPKGTIHLGVVDPGVGTIRRGIVVVTSKNVFIGPDNGLLINVARKQGNFEVFEITNDSLFNETISPTFHGRDIFAPVAAHIVRGIPFNQIGRKIMDYVVLPDLKPKITDHIVEVDILFIDDFGNIITNLDAVTFHSFIKAASTCKVNIKEKSKQIPYISSYGYIAENQLLVTIGSAGYVEIALNKGNASNILGLSIDDTITFDFS